MLGVAIRIAQRIGIHSEVHLAKYTALDAEMSRRLWWSLILFDTRIGEMADSKAISLLPAWDCQVPLNVNDSDLRQEMKLPPQVQARLTDTIFAVVRSEVGDFVRHSKFHLSFFGPALRPNVTDIPHDTVMESSEMEVLAKKVDEKYLKFCDLDNPLHFMTVWKTRGQLAKYQLMEHHFRFSGSTLHQVEAQRDAALSYALSMLECNTKLMSSPLTKGYIWMVYTYFPFMGYIQIVQHLKWRPLGVHAEEAWRVMSENFHARLDSLSGQGSFFRLLTSFVLQAWVAREAAFNELGESVVTPHIVLSIRESLAKMASKADDAGADLRSLDFPISIPLGMAEYDMGVGEDFAIPGMGVSSGIPGIFPQQLELDHLDWSAMDWNVGNAFNGATDGI